MAVVTAIGDSVLAGVRSALVTVRIWGWGATSTFCWAEGYGLLWAEYESGDVIDHWTLARKYSTTDLESSADSGGQGMKVQYFANSPARAWVIRKQTTRLVGTDKGTSPAIQEYCLTFLTSRSVVDISTNHFGNNKVGTVLKVGWEVSTAYFVDSGGALYYLYSVDNIDSTSMPKLAYRSDMTEGQTWESFPSEEARVVAKGDTIVDGTSYKTMTVEYTGHSLLVIRSTWALGLGLLYEESTGPEYRVQKSVVKRYPLALDRTGG